MKETTLELSLTCRGSGRSFQTYGIANFRLHEILGGGGIIYHNSNKAVTTSITETKPKDHYHRQSATQYMVKKSHAFWKWRTIYKGRLKVVFTITKSNSKLSFILYKYYKMGQ